jgi:hypothetical protein
LVVRDPETRLRFTETVTGEAKVKTGAGMVKDVPHGFPVSSTGHPHYGGEHKCSTKGRGLGIWLMENKGIERG